MYRGTYALGNLARYAPARQFTPATKQSTLLPQTWRASGTTSAQSSQQPLILNNYSNNTSTFDTREWSFTDRQRITNQWPRQQSSMNSIAEMSAWRATPLNPMTMQMRTFYSPVAWRQNSDVNTLEQNTSSTPERETETFNERIKALKREGNLLGIIREFSLMRSLNVPRNLLTYNLVLDSLIDLRQRDTSLRPILDVYNELMHEPNLRPSAYTYRVLIRAFAMRELEVCHARTQLETRLQWVDDDGDRARLAALSAEANLEQAMQLFEQARARFNDPFDINLMDLLLWATAERGDTEASLRVFEAIEASPVVSPTEQTFAALINSFGRAGDLEAARECFNVYLEQVEKNVFFGVDPSRIRIPFNNMAAALMRCGDLKGAHQLLSEVMPKYNIEPDEVTYNTLISGCAQAGDLESAERYLEIMKNGPKPIAPGPITYSILLSAACKQDAPAMAQRIFAQVIENGISLRYGNLMSFLELCIRQDDVHNILNILTLIERNRDQPENHFLQLMLNALQRPSIMVESKMDILRRVISLQVEYQNRVLYIRQLATCLADGYPDMFKVHRDIIRACYEHGVRMGTRLAESILRSYRSYRERMGVAELGRLMNRRDYAALCSTWFDRAIASVEPMDRVMDCIYELMEDMHANGLSYDINACANLAMRVHRASGPEACQNFVSHVERIFGSQLADPLRLVLESRRPELRNNAQRSPEDTNVEAPRQDFWQLCADIRALSRMPAKLDEMVVRLNELFASGAMPPPDLMRSALFALSAVGRMPEVLDLGYRAVASYDRVTNEKTRADMRQAVLSTIIMSCAKNNDAAGARRAYDIIRADGSLPSRAAYGELLRLYTGDDDLEEGMRMYAEMKRAPSPYFGNVLLSKVAKYRGYQAAADLFKEMCDRGMVPTAVTYGTLINAACKENNEERALFHYGEMCRRPEQENIAGPFHTMMQFALSRGDRASVLRYLTAMRRRMVTPQPHTYRLLIEAYTYAQPRDMALAEQSLREMLKANMRPAGTHYAPLLIGNAEEGNMEKVKWLWSELQIHPHLPDETAYLAGIAAAEKGNDHEFAKQLREEMFAKKGIVPPETVTVKIPTMPEASQQRTVQHA